MDIILYEQIKHEPYIKEWLSHRDLNNSLSGDLPENSYLAVHENLPIAAAGFLKTNGDVALLVGLITNPLASIFLRSDAVDELTKHIIKKSEYLGFKKLLSWSKNKSVIERSKKHGFEEIPQVMMGVELGRRL